MTADLNATKPALPSAVTALLNKCPKNGGTNKWLYKTAKAAHPFFPEKQELINALLAASARSEKRPTELEVEEAVVKTVQSAREEWLLYVNSLPWKQGLLDESSWKAAMRGARLNVPDPLMTEEIARRIEGAGDTPKLNKVVSQIRRSRGCVGSIVAGLPPGAVMKPRFCETKLKQIASQFPESDCDAFLASRSPFEPAKVTSADFLNALYHLGEKVLAFTVFESQGQCLWPHQTLPTGGPDGVWFLANPVDGKHRWNPRQHKPSRRSQESVTSFRFAVLESDVAKREDWLRCLVQLPLRIAAIYESGGKSIHALVQIDATSKADWDAQVGKMKPFLVTLGADPAALTAVRLSRLPQAKRGDRVQRLLFLRPNPDAVPICRQPQLRNPQGA